MKVGKNDTKVVDHDFMEKQIEYLKHRPEGMKTGFLDLDYQWGGLKPGNTYLIGARPAMGKTALILNMVEYMAIKGNSRVAFFSLEQSKEQLINRLITIESKVENRYIRTGAIGEEEWGKITAAAEKIGNGNLIVNDTQGISVEELDQELSKDCMSGIKVVFIDYLQLLTTEYECKNKEKEIYHISELLKKIAEKHDIAIVVLSRISRTPEEREDHRPILADFSEREVANLYDHVSFIYRDEYYSRDTEMKNIAEIITSKNKNGNIGTVYLAWLPAYQRFCNLGKLH